MKFLKPEKGVYQYINKQRIVEIIRTIFMFLCAIVLYLIGYITLQTNKNIWTILAVLSILPAAKSAVSMIMFMRFSSISNLEYNEINNSCGNIPVIYELVFTTTEKAYYVKSAACCDNNCIVLYDNLNKKDFSKELKDHLISSIQRDGLNNYTIKIYTKIEDYTKRLTEMNSNLNGVGDTTSKRLFALFKAITI